MLELLFTTTDVWVDQCYIKCVHHIKAIESLQKKTKLLNSLFYGRFMNFLKRQKGSLAYPSMEGQKFIHFDFIKKFFICAPKMKKILTGLVITVIIFIFGWTHPLRWLWCSILSTQTQRAAFNAGVSEMDILKISI